MERKHTPEEIMASRIALLVADRELCRFFAKRYPEHAQVFEKIAARADIAVYNDSLFLKGCGIIAEWEWMKGTIDPEVA